MPRLRPLLVAAALAAWGASCSPDHGGGSGGGATNAANAAQTTGSGNAGGSSASVVAAADEIDTCSLIPVAEIERIIGPLDGAPVRDGNGCWYYVPLAALTPEQQELRESERRPREAGADSSDGEMTEPPRPGLHVDVDLTGSALAPVPRAARETPAHGATDPGDERQTTGGWDQVGSQAGPSSFIGRRGHITVTAELQDLRTAPDTLAALAARLRDRIPDRPFADPDADPTRSPPADPDPCSLLTRAEAESELGPLVVPPFRTRDRSPLADPAGTSCAYFTPGHRVLILTPEWTYGRQALDGERFVGGLIRQVADLPGVVADTLEGPWDDAVVGLSGDLILLKGARSLAIGYAMSATDAAGAIRLAGPALERLVAAPETRAGVSDDGCPLPVAVVTEILQMPVRTKVNGTGLGLKMCDYELKEDPTVVIDLTIRPSQAAESVFEEIRSNAISDLGPSAQADRIDVGEAGWAYGSESGSEAAARAGANVYQARILYPLTTTGQNQKDAMVRLVARMIG